MTGGGGKSALGFLNLKVLCCAWLMHGRDDGGTEMGGMTEGYLL